MILVTVGTDLPFDRMMKVVDRWAVEARRTDVFAQIGEGGWVPRHVPSATMLEPAEFKRYFREADVIVAHAGMGTILSALHHKKPLLVMPKRASLGEQRNEHQLATCRYMLEQGRVAVALDEEELRIKLDEIDGMVPRPSIGSAASDELLQGVREFINDSTRTGQVRIPLLESMATQLLKSSGN